MKQVRETAAGKSIAAWIILNRKGDCVATIQAHYGTGRTMVDVWTPQGRGPQQSWASGYGYDKLTNALSGVTIDGHKLTNHCARDGAPKMPKGRKLYPRDFKAPKGYSLANFSTPEHRSRWNDSGDQLNGEEGYSDCYRDSGLKYLEAIGYRVLQAI